MTNRLRDYFEIEEAKQVATDELRRLADELGVKLQLALIQRLGPELASRVAINLSIPSEIILTPAASVPVSDESEE